ncbi:MAG: hypothetical protein EZS28_056089 [Streblomastix strix]|uniref:Sel1 repeat family protein n=1 Tax=Streblomastix strix TaxID=222440 RepID=A0A5J4PRZ3_9EUKA|nr:MAG: hypothetical protein EZS28_056089 [Streblomastix strix]
MIFVKQSCSPSQETKIVLNLRQQLKYFEIAGNGGNATALYNLAVMHTTGEGCEGDGVPVNIQLAARYFRMAAKQGDLIYPEHIINLHCLLEYSQT